MADHMRLAADFAGGSREDWLKAVEKALKGRPLESLTRMTDDGIAVAPLYTRDASAARVTDALPGAAPFVRGAHAWRPAEAPWTIAQVHTHPIPAAANAAMLADLEGGVSGLVLRLHVLGHSEVPSALADGVQLSGLGDVKTLLDGVLLDLVPLVLEAADWPVEAAAAVLAHYENTKVDPASAHLHLGIDPLLGLALAGAPAAEVEDVLHDGAALAQTIAGAWPHIRVFGADGEALHAGGASEAQELAGVMAAGLASLRAMEAAGLDVGAAAARITLTLAADADQFLTIAKLRAARLIWSRIVSACGAEPVAATIIARTARRMMHTLDPWVNMLRTTTACFAAGVGGADMVSVLPYTERSGLADGFAQRIARNTQIILQEESQIGRVLDPAGGSWYVEALTKDLAEAAWTELQAIEGEGGLLASLKAGAFQERVRLVSLARSADIAVRKKPLTGVSEFPALGEGAVETETVDEAALAAHIAAHTKALKADKTSAPDAFSARAWIDYAASGAPLARLHASGEPGGAPLAALHPAPLGAAFERLRAAAAAHGEASGSAPKIFLANLGPVAAFNARATFARNFFEAGGIEAISNDGFEEAEAAAEAFAGSGASLAVLCSSDALYTEKAVAVASALMAKGATALYLAGQPGDQEEAYRAAGIRGFVHVRANIVDALVDAHEALGIGPSIGSSEE